MKHANGRRLTSAELLEARRARARGKRAKLAKTPFKGNPYDYTTAMHKHQAWSEGYSRS